MLKKLLQNQQNLKACGIYSCTGIYFFKLAIYHHTCITKKTVLPDGLCGGPLAAALDAPLVLTKDGGAGAAADYVAENGIASGYVLGGDGALADETVVEVFGLESAAEIK